MQPEQDIEQNKDQNESSLQLDIPEETTIGETTRKIASYYFDKIVNLLQDNEQHHQLDLKKQQIILRLVELGYEERQYLSLVQQAQNLLSTLNLEQFVTHILQQIDEQDEEAGDEEISKPSPVFYTQQIINNEKITRMSLNEGIDAEADAERKFTFGIPSIKSKYLKKLNISDPFEQLQKLEPSDKANIQENLQACTICCNEKPIQKFYTRTSCSHTICETCILDYINYKIDNSQVEQIQCFNSCCIQIFSQEEIDQLLEKQEERISKYHRILNRNKIMQNPNNKFCTKPDCQGFITVNPNSSQSYEQCNVCSTQICIKCFNQWHPRVSCSQNIEKSIQRYIDKNVVQLCPKCKIKIEKITGCNHITCSLCKYEWCWLCKSKYSRSHFEKFNPIGCPGFYKQKQEWPMIKIYLYRLFCIFFWILYCLAIPILFYFYISSRYGLLFIKKKRNSSGCKKVIFYSFGVIWLLLGPALFPVHLIHYLYWMIVKNCKCCMKKKFVIEEHRPRNSALFNLSEHRSLQQFRRFLPINRVSIPPGVNNNNFELRSIPTGSRIVCRLQRSPYHVNHPYPSRVNGNNLQIFDDNKDDLQDSPYPYQPQFSPQRPINYPNHTQSPQKLTRKNQESMGDLNKENNQENQADPNMKRFLINLKQTSKLERRRPSNLIGIRDIKSMDWKNQRYPTAQELQVQNPVPTVRSSQTLDLK